MAVELKYAVEKPRLVIGFLALFSFILAAALRAGWRATFHNLLQLLARFLNVSIGPYHPFGSLAQKVSDADTNVYNWLGKLKDASGHAFITLCLWVAMQVIMLATAVAALSYELLRHAHIVAHRTSVTVVKKTVNVITKPIAHDAVKGRVAHDARVPALEREIATLRQRINEQAAELSKVQAVTVPVAVPIPAPRIRPIPAPAPVPIPRTLPKVSDLTHAWDAIKKRLGRITKLGTVAGLIGLTAGVLSRLGMNWARCSRVRKVGKNICGINDGLLDALLADALLVVGAISVVEFAKELQAIEGEVLAGLERFVTEI